MTHAGYEHNDMLANILTEIIHESMANGASEQMLRQTWDAYPYEAQVLAKVKLVPSAKRMLGLVSKEEAQELELALRYLSRQRQREAEGSKRKREMAENRYFNWLTRSAA